MTLLSAKEMSALVGVKPSTLINKKYVKFSVLVDGVHCFRESDVEEIKKLVSLLNCKSTDEYISVRDFVSIYTNVGYETFKKYGLIAKYAVTFGRFKFFDVNHVDKIKAEYLKIYRQKRQSSAGKTNGTHAGTAMQEQSDTFEDWYNSLNIKEYKPRRMREDGTRIIYRVTDPHGFEAYCVVPFRCSQIKTYMDRYPLDRVEPQFTVHQTVKSLLREYAETMNVLQGGVTNDEL